MKPGRTASLWSIRKPVMGVRKVHITMLRTRRVVPRAVTCFIHKCFYFVFLFGCATSCLTDYVEIGLHSQNKLHVAAVIEGLFLSHVLRTISQKLKGHCYRGLLLHCSMSVHCTFQKESEKRDSFLVLKLNNRRYG